jgi:cytochrome b subunit of formate dehydrogenase
MRTNIRINHLAILVCFILLTGLGFLWYGPLFGEPWMDMVGLDMAEVEANPPGAGIWISNIIATVIPLYALAWLFKQMGVDSGIRGAGIGLLISFSFVFLSKLAGDLFAQNPYALSWITGGYDMVSLTLAGFILGAWPKRKTSGE